MKSSLTIANTLEQWTQHLFHLCILEA